MRRGLKAISALALATCLGSPAVTWAQSASRAVLEGVEVTGDGAAAVVTVGFALPVRYVRHFPESRGNELRITVVPAGAFATNDDKARFREAVRPSGFDDRAPVDEVTFERDETGATVVTVRFSRAVSYRAGQGRDARSIAIELPAPSAATTGESVATPSAASARRAADGGFVVNLVSSDRPLALPSASSNPAFAAKTLYATTLKRDGRTWYRLRLGFFATAPEAELAAARARSSYPQAWVDTTAADEETPAPPSVAAGATAAQRPATAAGVLGAMTAAEEAMAAGDYERAIQLYGGVLDAPPSAAAKEAREMLGVARERNGQLAHAKVEYERYLAEWPDGEDADRVRQRLNSLVGRGSKPKEKLRDVAKGEGWSFDEWGSFSTFYRRDERYADEQGDETTQSLADTNLDLGLRASRGENDLRLAFNGGYTLDLLESEDSETDINELYLQYARTRSWISARAGRQSRSKGGVLGRFDGMLLGYKPAGWVNINVTTGFPVKTWEDTVDVNDERRFAGLSVDLGPFDERWDFNLFFIDQEVADVTDRRAIGGEARYLDRERSLFLLLDYDVFYDVLNTAYVIGSTTLPYDLRADASLRYGTTPILTTSNALIGQPFDSMDDLLDVFSKDEVYDLARDRTADGVTFTASATRDLTERFQLNGDFAFSTISSTDTSGGVDEIPDTGNEFFYGLQLIGSGVFKQGDVSVAGLRYSDGDTANLISLDLHTRLPLRTAWWLGPRLVFDYEPSENSDDRDLRVRPRLRVEYKWRKHHRFEVEGGGQYMREGSGDDAENVYGYTAEAGYRFDF